MSSQGIFKNLGKMVLRRAEPASPASPDVDNKGTRFIPGNEYPSRMDPWWWLVAAVALLIILLITLKADPFWDILVFVRDGIWMTFRLTVISFVLIIVVGIIGGLGRISKNPVIHLITSLYVEIVRGIPLLVQLIWWYLAAPAVIQEIGRWLSIPYLAEYRTNAFLMAVVGLVVCYGAYMTEIFRAGIQSIPKGQMEAARSQGMTYFQAMRHVVLPQAFRLVLPPVGNEFIMLIKDTSLVSAVALADLTRRGREFMSTHFNPIETWTMVALLYLVMTLFAARLISYLESKRTTER
ncbi:MAG: amino acid ABC transporter permease [Dehalococcoidales bacterium]|nr:amino acid ABC transporter permease [Dehalococcoidales bacterium]